ncbi:MAG: hypothetical protein ACTSWQ_03975 [Candidatus Thorarchaeota archaeon]
MGYTTNFEGQFDLDKPLSEEQISYLNAFNETRRMKRNPHIAEKMDDPTREAVGLPIGKEGEFFVGGIGFAGQDRDDSVLEYNCSPSTQPSLWCQWTPNEEGTAIIWDEGEKFHEYAEWLEYIVENFIKPWGYTLNGEVTWDGEEPSDIGKIVVEDNEVKTLEGTITYE